MTSTSSTSIEDRIDPVDDATLVARALLSTTLRGGPWPSFLTAILRTPVGCGYLRAVQLHPEQRAEVVGLMGPSVATTSDGFHHAHLWHRLHALGFQFDTKRDPEPTASDTCLYRFHDDAGRLLYVGISKDPNVRERQHAASQRWYPLVAEREDEWYPNRRDALRAEAAAILNESPLFNEAGRSRLPALPVEVDA